MEADAPLEGPLPADSVSAGLIRELLDRLEHQSKELTQLHAQQREKEQLLAKARNEAETARILAAEERERANRLEAELARIRGRRGWLGRA